MTVVELSRVPELAMRLAAGIRTAGCPKIEIRRAA